MLTTAEAAALLNERGLRTAKGETYTAKMIQQYCRRGLFPGAVPPDNPRRGYWQIPRASVEAFQARQPGRPPAALDTVIHWHADAEARDRRQRRLHLPPYED